MREALAQSSERIDEISRLTRKLETLASRASAQFDSTDYLFDEEDTVTTRKVYEHHGHKK